MQNKNNNKAGFTIIETMIAVALFLIIITVGIGSLLNTTLFQQKSENMRSIMDNVSFIMEDISRNLRTGYDYHCSSDLLNLGIPSSCASGRVIAFKSNTGAQWVYKLESSDGGFTYNMSKSVNDGASWTQLNPSEISFDSASNFSVIGAESGDNKQPFATTKFIGEITYKGVLTPFSLQTSVSQRLIDI